MSKQNKNQKLRNEIAELEIKKRNGLMRAVAAFVGMFVLILGKLLLADAGVEWVNEQWVNMALFVLALVAAGICGIGARDWKRAKDAINAAYSKLK